MGAGYRFQCYQCGYAVCTSGPWEFYRDAAGNRKPYGHPVAFSREAEERGISGLWANLYCPTCDQVRDLIVVEFNEPTRDKFALWSGALEPREEYKREDAVCCPTCGHADLILRPEDGRPTPCPRCPDGWLQGAMEWIS